MGSALGCSGGDRGSKGFARRHRTAPEPGDGRVQHNGIHPRHEAAMTTAAARYELRFQPLVDAGRGLAFDCDAEGHVDLDAMNERARLNYLYARTLIGRDFAAPAVRALH
jgi:hypothetical protein